jgi:hypothetical protein
MAMLYLNVDLKSQPGGAKALLETELSGGVVGLAWLGQSGFLIRHCGLRVLIDPYLSNFPIPWDDWDDWDALGRFRDGRKIENRQCLPALGRWDARTTPPHPMIPPLACNWVEEGFWHGVLAIVTQEQNLFPSAHKSSG